MRELILRFRGNTSGLNKSFDEARKNMGGLATEAAQTEKKSKGSFAKLAGALGGFAKKAAIGGTTAAVAGLGYALKKGFDRLTSIEDARAKLTGLGHSTKAVQGIMDNALAAVKGTAFGMDEAATTAAGSVAAGIKPGKDLERTLKLVADAATIGGTSMGEMGAIFNKVATSNKIQGDVINQLNDKGIPIIQLLAKQLGVSGEEVAKLASKGKIDFETFRKAMQAGVGGAAAESGKTTKGAFKNMLASISRTGANLLSGVFPLFQKSFSGITSLMQPMEDAAKSVGANLGGYVAAGVEKIQAAWSAYGPGLIAGLTAFRDRAGELGAKAVELGKKFVLPQLVSFGKNMAAALSAAKPLIAAIGTNLSNAFSSLQPYLITAGKVIGGAVLLAMKALPPAVAGVMTGLTGLMNVLQPVTKHLDTIAKVAGVVLAPALLVLGVQAIKSAGQQVVAWAMAQASAVKSSAAQVAALYKTAAGWAMSAAAAVKSGAETIYVWALMKADAVKSAAAQVASWAKTRIAAVTSAAQTAAAWVMLRVEAAKSTAATIASNVKAAASFVVQRTAMVATAVASKAMAAAQWVLNAAMTANPIGLIIAGLVALAAGLVLAYKKSETFRNIVNGVWSGIKKVALAVANWFVQSALPMIKKVFSNIALSAQLMWSGVKKVFNLYRLGIATIVKVVVGFAKHIAKNFETIRSTISAKITWVRTWLSQTWSAIRSGTIKIVTNLRDGISNRFTAIRNGIRDKIGWAGTWLAKNWRGIRTTAVNVVAKLRDGVLERFTAVRNGVRDRVATMRDWVKSIFSSARTSAINIVAKLRDGVISRFTRVRDWAKNSFSKIQDYLLNPLRNAREYAGKIVAGFGNRIMGAAKVPVEFLIRYVYNRGIREVFNKAAKAIPGVNVELPHVDFPSWPKFDSGGIFMPNRYTPGRDIGFAALSGGEPIMRPEFGRAVGHGTIHALNKAARSGGVQGVKNALGSYMGGFKNGGIAGTLSGGSGRFSALAQKTLLQAQQMAGVTFNIFQRGYRPTTSYSGTSHAGDAIDLAPVTGKVVEALRRAGWAAWDRTGKGNWAPHIHGVPLPGYGHAGGSGVWQAQDYLKGGDGLGGKDNGPRGLIGKAVAGIGALGSLAADLKNKVKKPLDQMKGKFGSSALGDIARGAGAAIRDFVIDKGAMLINPLASVGHKLIGSAASWAGSKFGGWNGEQLDIAAIIIDVANKLGFGDRGAKIGLSTGIVESNLRNVNYGDRDSLGIMQQRAPWGPAADRLNPAKAASMFFTGGQGGQPGLADKNWRSGDLGALAQAVQVSGLPWRYGQEMGKASELLKRYKAKKFDSGGWLPPGPSMVMNQTGGHEPMPVFTSPQWDTLNRIANGGGEPKVVINIDGALDPDAVARQVQRLLVDAGHRRSGITIGSRTR